MRGEINLNELLSLDELAEILSSLDPDVLRVIADYIRHKRSMLEYLKNPPGCGYNQ